MAEPPLILVLAGTGEARALLETLATDAKLGRLRLVASLAGATRKPAPLPCKVRTGGFGGAEGLAAWLREANAAAVVDATHPFATRISANAAAACASAGLPRLALVRPSSGGGARRFPSLRAARDALPPGARALAATGRASASEVTGREDVTLFLRVAEAGAEVPGATLIVSRPPHDAASERALFARLRPTHLIARDAGGADDAKLAAAQASGIETWLIARPAPEPGPQAGTVAEAADWVRRVLASGD